MVGLAAYSLIFGGCCSNVFTLEGIIAHEPDSGLLITVTQLVLTTLFCLPSNLQRTSSHSSLLPYRLKSPNIPLDRLAYTSLMFFAINMLNNWAFAFQISVPMHIILRSFGSVQTLAVGWMAGKRYSRVQVGSVAVLTIGVVVSAWADAQAKKGVSFSLASLNPLASTSSSTNTTSYAYGLLILFTAQLISAYMGIYTEHTYSLHGRQNWREILFYSHFFGLLLSFAFTPTLLHQLRRLLAGPPASLHLPSFLADNIPSSLLQRFGLAGAGGSVPKSLVLLFLNGATQVACISGVNLLSAQTNAVTVTVVLNVRKLVSFLLSCVVFGNPLGGLMAVGAGLVFVSGAVYGWDETRRKGRGMGSGKPGAAKEVGGGGNVGVKGENGGVRKVEGKVT